MAEKLLKPKVGKRVAPRKATAKKPTEIVIVGNYKAGQLEWIKKNGIYNYPVREDDGRAGSCPQSAADKKSEFSAILPNVRELWLYANVKSDRHVFSAQFVGKMTKGEFLAAYPSYAKLGPSRQKAYYVFKTQPVDYPPELGNQLVLARAADFGGRSVKVKKAIEQFKADGEFASLAAYLPKELAKVPRPQLRVCEATVQTDFLVELMPVVAKALSKKNFRLATVFSGIGAIEQALLRTHVDHEIVFACDNGDQTPFLCGAVEWQECVDTFKKLREFVKEMHPTTESQRWAAEMIKKQSDTIQSLLNGAPAMSKRPERELKDRVQMLHEAIGFYKFRVTWEAEKDWQQRKQLVDMLYRPLLARNKVRQSYVANYPVTDDRFHWNVTFLEGRPYRDQVDLFVGGSPCQSFSLVGKQMGLSDTRGTLFYEYARLVSEIRPKCFIYENVRALLSNDGGKTWATMAKVFTDLGYDWKHQVLNSKDYGIPQNRERVFVVGFRKDLGVGDRFEFPKPKKLETTMQDCFMFGKENGMSIGGRCFCRYVENGRTVENDQIEACDVQNYFKDCFRHHVGRFPSRRQFDSYFTNGYCLSRSRSLCREWFCDVA